MKVLNLRCAHDHCFEGWFAGDDDLATQSGNGTLTCPMCGDAQITRLPSAPHVVRGTRAGDAERGTPPATGQGAQQAEWMRQVRAVLEGTVDVGERFATEARRIHYGEAEERPIRGRATAEEAQALVEEGIEVRALPLPEPLKGTLQ